MAGVPMQGECVTMNNDVTAELRERYPFHIPIKVAAPLLGVSPRQLTALVASGRVPFASIGANVGIRQNYVRIYTERLISYLNGDMI